MFEFGQLVKGVNGRDEWHSFAVTNFVQGWVNGESNFGFMVKASDESTGGPIGGPAYQASEAGAFGGETQIRPQLVINYAEPQGDPGPGDDLYVPGVTLDYPLVVHPSGPELAWSAYNDPSPDEADNLVEYQIFRGCVTLPASQCTTPVTGEDYTPGSPSDGIDLVGTVAPDVTSWTDTTALSSTATQDAVYRYWVVARVVADTPNGQDGRSASNPQTVTVPREGRIVRVITGNLADTTLSKLQPNTILPKPGNKFWLQAGNTHTDYGVERALLAFDTAAIKSPGGKPVKVTDARLQLWESEGVGSGATFDMVIPDCVPTGSPIGGGAVCKDDWVTHAYEDQAREWGANTDGWVYTASSYADVVAGGGGLARLGARTSVRLAEKVATRTATKTVTGIPDESVAVLRSIEENGVIVQSGVRGPSAPRTFANDGRNGGQLLPTVDSTGQTITYREWGTVPGSGNPKPGGERIVVGSDGSIYYSPDHYQTYIRWEP